MTKESTAPVKAIIEKFSRRTKPTFQVLLGLMELFASSINSLLPHFVKII